MRARPKIVKLKNVSGRERRFRANMDKPAQKTYTSY